ncbi:MAG: serine protease [Eubacteriales bacterium]
MNDYIVKVRAYNDTLLVKCGTGIVIISGNAVLTAEHVTCGTRHTILISEGNTERELEVEILKKNDVATILSLQVPLPCKGAGIFTNQSILDPEIPWQIYGYITDDQIPHEIIGVGISRLKFHRANWDCELNQINSGRSQNYKGLSGSPVLSYGRIVGILQMQIAVENGSLGLRMSSVDQFCELLSDEDLKPNAYELAIQEKSRQQSSDHIEQNKKSGKYIPDIFVEESEYKEKLRYFAEPYRFLGKAVKECHGIDFSTPNKLLAEQGQPQIYTSVLTETVYVEEMEQLRVKIVTFLQETCAKLEMLSREPDAHNMTNEEYCIQCEKYNNSAKFAVMDIAERVQMTGTNYVLLTKQAGQGKTNLLCDFTENFLLKKDYCVWYYNAYELLESPMDSLKHEWSINGQYDPVYCQKVLEQRWKRTGRPAILVIDGLNENTAVANFGQSMCNFIDECTSLPFLKIIMTTREELLEKRFGCLLKMVNHNTFCHMKIQQAQDDFKDRIFWGYLGFFDIDIRQDTLMQTTYDILTEDVLLLRFFCEVESHKRQIYMYNIYKYDVFQKYLEKKAAEYNRTGDVDTRELFYDLLEHICRCMLERKVYFQIPMNGFNHDEQQIMNMMLENDVIFKGETLIEKGLMKRECTAISFTFDEFRDFCLTNYIMEKYDKKVVFLDFWNNMHKDNTTICEGVERYTFFLAMTNSRDKLLPWLKECSEYDRLYWENIWNIEDRFLTLEDVLRWKEQLLYCGSHSSSVVYHLLSRFDYTYFKTANFRILLDAMDEILTDLGQYTKFIRYMFSPNKLDRHCMNLSGNKSVWPYNEMLITLTKMSTLQEEPTNNFSEYFRLTIYLYELMPHETQKLWINLFSIYPEIACVLLENAVKHPKRLIQGNAKDILSVLLAEYQEGAYGTFLTRLYEENVFGQNFEEIVIKLTKIFNEE